MVRKEKEYTIKYKNINISSKSNFCWMYMFQYIGKDPLHWMQLWMRNSYSTKLSLGG